MNRISHKQAVNWINRRLDGLLTEEQVLLLEGHLTSCDSCRAYAAGIESLSAQLHNEFHARWDEEAGPSQKIMQDVTSKARKFPMTKRFFSTARWFAGAAALIGLAFVINFIVSRLQHVSPVATNMTPALISSAHLQVDPQTCKPASEMDATLQPPNELYGYELIQGTSLVDGDFSYEFWLYCDPSMKPNNRENSSTIAGLGIFSSWQYDGPKIEGTVEYHYEFEPNIVLGESSWNGPLYRSSATGAKFGIDIPETEILTAVWQGSPVRFRAVIDSPIGHKEAIFSFRLELTKQGLKIASLHAEVERLTPAQDRLIAFVSEQPGNPDIYAMHADGSGVTNLTNNAAYDSNPFWSPDGKRIAFQSDRNGSMQIYRMDADGSHVTRVTNDNMDDQLENSNPWSPDGTRLLFTEREPSDPAQQDAKWMLNAVDLDGQNKIPVTQVPSMYGFPSWSPDGKQIAFIAVETQGDRNTIHIYVVDANGGDLTDITKLLSADEEIVSGNYLWSRNGQSISFIAHKHIDEGKDQWIAYEASLDGGKLTRLATSSTPMSDWWDGTAFITGFGDESTFTWLRSDGTYSTLKPFEKCVPNDASSSSYIYRRSPNGNLLIGVNCPNGDLWFYWANQDGTVIKQLLDAPTTAKDFSILNIVWSTDDKYAAFNVASPDKTHMDMYILNVEAALADPSIQPLQIKAASDSSMYNWYPAWQPKP